MKTHNTDVRAHTRTHAHTHTHMYTHARREVICCTCCDPMRNSLSVKSSRLLNRCVLCVCLCVCFVYVRACVGARLLYSEYSSPLSLPSPLSLYLFMCMCACATAMCGVWSALTQAQVAAGLAHLHEERIVHRDVASRNIMVCVYVCVRACVLCPCERTSA